MPLPKINIEPERYTAVAKTIENLHIKNVQIARAMRRSPAAVTFALQGKRPILFQRIERFVRRVEKNRLSNMNESVSQQQTTQSPTDNHA